MQYEFYRYALLADLLRLVVERAFTYQEFKKSWNVTVSSIIVKDH